jgi:hypothetical protein
MTSKRSLVAATTAVLMLSSNGAATAQESPTVEPEAAPARAERNHSINLGIGTLGGVPSISYEYMWTRGHGLVLEITGMYRPTLEDTETGIGGVVGLVLEASGVSRPSGESGSMGIGGAIGYRWRWRQRHDSGFLGVHVGYDIGESVAENSSIDWVIHKTFYVVGNIGRRWLLRNDFNITARVGAGLAYRSIDNNYEADVVASVRFLDDLLDQFPVTVDGELSLGYTF